MTDTEPRFTLRALPLPAKLVVTAFLMAVGIGYFSALVQLHFQHSDQDGTPMPTVDNVVAVFAGKRKANGAGDAPKSRLEMIISGPRTGALVSSNMTPAFFSADETYKDEIKSRPPSVVNDEREGERRSVVAWTKLDPVARKTAYDRDSFEVPAELVGNPVPQAHRIDAKTVKIKSIFKARCESCHAPGKDKSDIPLDTYDALEPLMKVGAAGKWVDSGKQIGLVKLTQSTHAHLLSFSMLFSLTGLAFAFTSYPAKFRCLLAPFVVVMQFLDVACWWLARLPESGPYFAMCIVATGGAVGMGLAAQIVLSLFNMYGPKGKAVLVCVFAFGLAVFGAIGLWWVEPYLADEKAKKAALGENRVAPGDNGNGKATPPAVGGEIWGQKVVTGAYVKGSALWSGKSAGGMVRAFFNKDPDFKDAEKKEAMKPGDPDFAKLLPERETERALVAEWFGLADADRKKAYEADSLPIPEKLASAPLTAEFKAGAGVKIKSLIDARCVVCHGKGGDKEDAPMDTYESLRKYFGPPPADKEKADVK